MKLSEFVSQQSVKAGANITEEANKAFFEALAAVNVDIPDTLAQSIDNKFITVESAKNNHPELKAHYAGLTLNAIDKGYREVLTELQVPQDVIDQIFNEPSTYKRGPLLAKTLKELEAKKAAASSPDKAAINKQIEELQAQIRIEKENATKSQTERAQFEKDMKLKYKKDSLYSKVKTIYDSLEPEERNDTLDVITNRALQESGALLDFDDSGNLVLLKKEGRTNYFGDNNTILSPSQFLDGILGRKKILVTNQSTAEPVETQTKPGQRAPVQGGSNGNKVNPLYAELNGQAVKDYELGSKLQF